MRLKARPRAFAAVILALPALGGIFAGPAFASPRVYPTGVTVYDPVRAYNSFICFSAPDGQTHLVDIDGNEAHRWPHAGLPGAIIDPKLLSGQRGHVLLNCPTTTGAAGSSPTGRSASSTGTAASFKVTSQGGIVWEHMPPYLGRTQVDGKPFISILVSSGASAPEPTKSARLQDQETTYGVYVGRCHTRTDEMLKVDGNAVFEPTPPPQPLGFPTARLAMMKNG